MLAESTSIGITEIIAVYAAFVATGVLVWDIYKWKTSGPRILLTTVCDMTCIGMSNMPQDKTVILVTATNSGNLPTTIKVLGLRHYKNWMWRIRRKTDDRRIISKPYSTHPLPSTLEPGKEWMGFIEQNEEMEALIKSGILFCELCLSHSRKPKLTRIRL